MALELKAIALAPSLIDDLVPLAQQVIEPIIVERFTSTPATEPHDKRTGSTAGLSLLYIMALGCMCEDEHITRFWKYVHFDTTLMIFTRNQLMADIEIMLKLLSTSVFRDSFGAPSPDEKTVFNNILNKITLYFMEVPNKPNSDEKHESKVVSSLRLQVLQLMMSMIRSPYASKFMASHRDVVGRLVHLISEELDLLYDYKSDRHSR